MAQAFVQGLNHRKVSLDHRANVAAVLLEAIVPAHARTTPDWALDYLKAVEAQAALAKTLTTAEAEPVLPTASPRPRL